MAENRKLNKEQLQAVRYKKGPLLIIAGAGTGKTTVITERIKYLIQKDLAKPSEILALTFTEKASREMEERVDQVMPYGYTQMWISTFHSFCDRVLRDSALHIGMDPRYKLMTEAETIQLIRANLFKFNLDYFRPLGNPTKFVSGMIQHFSRLQDEDTTPTDYIRWVNDKLQMPNVKSNKEEKMEWMKWKELAEAYKKYEELKVKEGRVDYGDLIVKSLYLFRQRSNILSTYQKQFKYILVDEFQDTNVAQYELLKLLAPPKNNGNLTVVGDDSQCLPPDTKIATINGNVKIKNIRVGDKVLTAVGKGHTSLSKVARVYKRKRKAKIINLKTEDGKTLKVTDNHKLFSFIPAFYTSKDWHFVYLMHQENLGWRIGVTNNLPARLRLEHHADRIFALGSFKTDQEARFYEAYLSAKYSLPTVTFYPRPGQAISGKWLNKLFEDLDTNGSVQRLAKDFGLELGSPVFAVDGVTRGVSERVKVNLKMCQRNYRSKTHKNGFVGNPGVLHSVHLETSNNKVINMLEKAGFILQKAKKGKRFRVSTVDLAEAWKLAERLSEITGGIIDKKFVVGKFNYQHLPARIVPASHVFPGMYLPVLVGRCIEYKMVVSRREKIEKIETYDLEIEKTHNFIAEGIVVHNSIYKFRGAAVSNILYFKKDYKKAKNIILTKNYRSTQTILDNAYRLIQHNNPDTLESKLGIDKNLVSLKNPKGGESIVFIHKNRVENEAEAVAKEIGKLVRSTSEESKATSEVLRSDSSDGGYIYKDIAILVRANNHSEPFIRALQRHAIPYQFLGPGRLFRQPEIIELFSYLKVLYDFTDSVSFYRLLSSDYFDISARDLMRLGNFARRYNLPLFEAAEKIEDVYVSEDTEAKVNKLLKTINIHLEKVKKETAGQLLYYFLEDTGLLRKLLNPDTPEAEKKALNISKFFDKLKTYEVDHEDASVSAVVDWIELSSELGESPLAADFDWTKENAVNILSAHSAKGLEFPVVFIVNLVSQRFPTTERREQIPIPDALIKEVLPQGDYHLQEERRLFYVGMTRAENRLYFTAADYYGEGKREKKLSPFIFEALGDDAVASEQQNADSEQLSFLDYKPKAKPSEALAEEGEPITKSIQVHVDYLSYSQIDTFKICPLHYKLRYIFKVPTPPSASQSFGTSIHESIKKFYESIKDGNKPTEQLIFKILEENWIRIGFTSKSHEKKFYEKGKVYLSGFLKESFDPKIIPELLEQRFTLPLPYRKGEKSLKIGGVMDRIDVLPDKSLEIIDYKTGATIPTQKEVDNNLQLTFYALAATSIREEPFNKTSGEVKSSLYFLDSQEKLTTKKTKEQLENAVKEIYKVRTQIEESDFKCSGHMFCQNSCEYNLFCRGEGQ